MPFSASDNFNRADGPLGAPWDVTMGSWAILTNTANSNTASANCLARWDDVLWADDHRVEVTWFGGQSGPAVRVTGNNAYYFIMVGTTSIEVYRIVSAASALIQTINGLTLAVLDRFALEVEGSTLRIYRQPSGGGSWSLLDSIVDTTHTDGNAGIYGFSNSSAVDDFFGENIEPSGKTLLSRF